MERARACFIYTRVYWVLMMSKWAMLIQEALSTDATCVPEESGVYKDQQLIERATSTDATGTRQHTTDRSDQSTRVENIPSPDRVRIYPPSPIAIALLLVCCQKLGADRDEITRELLKLKDITQAEQIRRWLSACARAGIRPGMVFPAGVVSNNWAMDCMSCKHLEMILASRRGERKRYHWNCTKQHAILEAHYLGERVLLAPDTCIDYLPFNNSSV